MHPGDTPIPKPLSGIRILDLSQGLAGPFGTMFLGDLGAEVIRIETPEGDRSRRHAGPGFQGDSFHFLAFNRSKKSLVLDLQTTSGKEAFYDLVRVSDVVWDNFRSGVSRRLGTDYEALKKINPRIISSSITGFGLSGPYEDRKGFDLIAQAMAGILSVTGEPGGPPVQPAPPITDMAAGLFSAIGVLAAIIMREKTGEGQKVSASLLDVGVSLMGFHISSYLLSGVLPERLTTGTPHTVPYAAYKTGDGYIAIAAAWPRIARVVGADWMIDEPKYRTSSSRVKYREEIDRALGECFKKHTNEEWLALLEVEGIPAGPVNTVDRTVQDPQVVNDRMVIDVEHGLGGTVKVPGNPIKMSSLEDKYAAIPALGQHNEEILAGLLHYSPEKIAKLKAEQEKHAAELSAHLHKVY